ncbi:PREDICTED: multiple RNA-binding domain-containing protein 1 [Fragaria vesca subsp. vesca]|uniref:multiple RNA-binding domain-containing protein 1 n=1 Tax=Fragaria vesca subsp. vesca TaxID=101020 RepID=UPI0002C368DA|nr:PREDICTED: multiple RNA-binding domain-containing protein 1 [Fragaria vesca subsp. vesca]
MSRICVKNLPKHVDDKKLRELFSEKGEVTDAKLMRTREGKSRQFAFIGFRSELQAQEAIKYFNRTFVDTYRISCELARKVGDPEIPRPWSRHTKEKEKKESEAREGGNAAAAKSRKGRRSEKEEEIDDPKLKEFLQVMQPRAKSKLWSNDTFVDAKIGRGERKMEERRKGDEEKSAAEMDVDVEEEEDVEKGESHNVAKDNVVSDMDYFKSRVKKDWSDSESSDSDDEEEEEEKEKEEEEEDEVDEGEEGVEEVSDGTVLAQSDPWSTLTDEKDEMLDTSRLFVRNLPFTATEDELEEHFRKFGDAQVHLVIDKELNRSKGIAYVLYSQPKSVQRALEELDGSIFQGRLLHVMPAKQKHPSPGAEDLANQASKSLKQQREEKKKASEASGDTRAWNSLFIRTETAVDHLARKFGVSKSDFLDPQADDVAVRVAQAETQVIAQTKKALTNAGVNVESLENFAARKAGDMKRSNHVLLVKNLPYGSSDSELGNMFGKFGSLEKIIMPPTKTLALVVFFEPSGARAAFKGLAYKKYKDVPLYLEWAPGDVLNPSSTAESNGKKNPAVAELQQLVEVTPDDLDLDPDRVESRTLYVKNLNFKTTDESLKKHFEQVKEGKILSAKVKKHMKKGKNLSMGFGFVEFDSVETATEVCKGLQGTILDGHQLILQHCHAKQDDVPKKVVKDKSSTKILVKNVAFEATKKELRQLFSTYGEIKSLRLPNRLGQHRGFAFVEFATKQEAENAIQALASTHLYGRHLVLERAKEGETLEDLRARVAAQFTDDQNTVSRKRKAVATLDEDNMRFDMTE